MRVLQCVIGLVIFLGVAGEVGATTMFSDDFNRPDGIVGNGWTNNSVNDDMIIVGGRATAAGGGSAFAGITRPFAVSDDLRLKYTISATTNSGGSARWDSGLMLFDNGLPGLTGYGIYSNPGAVRRFDNGVNVDNIQFSGAFTAGFDDLTFDFVIGLDGSIVGSLTDGVESFEFNFGPRVIQSGGSNLSYYSTYAHGGPPDPTLDNLVISTIPEPSTLLLVSCGLLCMALRGKCTAA